MNNDNIMFHDEDNKNWREDSSKYMDKRILPIVVFALLACIIVIVFSLCIGHVVFWLNLLCYVAVGVVISTMSIISTIKSNDKLARVSYISCLIYLIGSPFVAEPLAGSVVISSFSLYITPFLAVAFILFANGLVLKNLYYSEKNSKGVFVAAVTLMLLSLSIMSAPKLGTILLTRQITYALAWLFPALKLVFCNRSLPKGSLNVFSIINIALAVWFCIVLIAVALCIAEVTMLEIGFDTIFFHVYMEFAWFSFVSYDWSAICIFSCVFELMYAAVFVLNIISARAEKKRLSA